MSLVRSQEREPKYKVCVMNYKGKKDLKFLCPVCNTYFPFKGYSFNNKFCSIPCFQEQKRIDSKAQEDNRYLLWLAGSPMGIVNPRPTIKKFVTKRDGYKCSKCGITDWNNEPISLWLDHKDGDASNNDPDNLRLMCPNCDSQSPTFGAKNYGRGRKSRGMRQYG